MIGGGESKNTRAKDHRRALRLPPRKRPDRGGGGARRLLRPSNEPHNDALAAPKIVRSFHGSPTPSRAPAPSKAPSSRSAHPPPPRDRVRAHAFFCLLASTRVAPPQAWAELLFVDEQPPLAADPVAAAERSQAARPKASNRSPPAVRPGLLHQPHHRARPHRPQHQPRPPDQLHLQHRHPLHAQSGARARTRRRQPDAAVVSNDPPETSANADAEPRQCSRHG